MNLPIDEIASEADLDELLSEPTKAVIELIKRIDDDIIILGIAGKMGITLGMMAKKAMKVAGVNKKVIGVARFSNPESKVQLENEGIETIACDLMDLEAVSKLPKVKNVIYMAGRKFGTGGSEELTWAMNVLVPHNVCKHFKGSNIVAFSTGCVYPLVKVETGGCSEEIPPSPVGEYAQSCLGRERVFEYFAKHEDTPVCLYRLNYAIDMRYGVLHDIGQQIINGEPVDLTVEHFNIIWQGDANAQALLCLDHCEAPAGIMNVTGPEIIETRKIAEQMAKYMDKNISFSKPGSQIGYLNNSAKATKLFGPPTVSIDSMVKWQSKWLIDGGGSFGKPTHFEVNNGSF